ncbi:MAG: hypothetical protein NT075_03565, partial [Chloroflexi bacterium]|nr:hypothetical protein [Chloroflexota bacterium]
EILDYLAEMETEAEIKPFIVSLRADIAADRQALEALMQALEITASPARRAAAWLAEKMTTLKLRLDDPTAGALRLLEALEIVQVGIEGKRALWRGLAEAHAPGLPEEEYRRLERRSEEQHARVEVVRLAAAKVAFHAPS